AKKDLPARKDGSSMPSLERFKWIPMIVKAYNQALQQTRARTHAADEASAGGGSPREGASNSLSLPHPRTTPRRSRLAAGTGSAAGPRLNGRVLHSDRPDNPADNPPGRRRNARTPRSTREWRNGGQPAQRSHHSRRTATPRQAGAPQTPQAPVRAAAALKPAPAEPVRTAAAATAPADARALPAEPRRLRVPAADRTAAMWRELRATRNALVQLEALQEELASAQADIRAQLQALLERLESAHSATVSSERHESRAAAPSTGAPPHSTPPPLQRS
ncbi:MAG: hypothetical protein K6T31_10425, partial [Alicyclobacillus sp.]|nr:hypothetical protein [Alicyclobacillus sp.]